MPKARAYGADATLKACREAGYGVAPLTGYRIRAGHDPDQVINARDNTARAGQRGHPVLRGNSR